MTDGFDVLVQEVMAAITTAPSLISTSCPLILVVATPSLVELRSAFNFFKEASNIESDSFSGIRSCGRLGPDIFGVTVEISNVTVDVYLVFGLSLTR